MNPDLVLVRRFMAGGGVGLPVDSSALAVALGARLEAWSPERRELVMGYEPDATFRQGAGVLQGGAVASMLDFAMAFAGFTQLADGAGLSTLTMNVVFQKAARGGRYTVRGRIEKPGRRVMFAAAEITDGDDVVATATSTLLVLPAA
ncbi:PaaI family thioesterase [Aquibium carbonis]|uniref:PaaI family thioesterase n=1 Tax=Aquibium carbonis TaxID=2495581 RepID=A0A3S0G6R0_9HYPH|nr:PaaI family thioesterase [Aquibium carbonis]RST85026.1 PaaI family thioesterase [Aquibium carbonis]